MNSNYGRSNNNFDFDLGLNSNRSRPLNDQKNNKSSSYSSSSSSSYSSSSSSSYTSTQPNRNTNSPWQPNKPSWTHQPAPTQSGSLTGPTSMVGDITGRSWNSVTPPSSGIGIPNKNPKLFSDLLGPALGQNKSNNTKAPLKNATTSALNKNAYSMGNMADSLPKTTAFSNSGSTWSSSAVKSTNNKSPNLGGPSMKGSSSGMSSNKDPFGSLVDFSSKTANNMNSGSKANRSSDSFGEFSSNPATNLNTSSKANHSNDLFGDFSSKPATNLNTSSQANKSNDPFGDFQEAFKQNTTAGFSSNTFVTSNTYTNLDDFSVPPPSHTQPPVQSSGFDSVHSLFASTATKESDAFSGNDHWDTEFGGGDGGGTTTELDGLPPPPAGVTVMTAKNKGMDNYKQGQYPDAIKWLSWAILLLEKGGDKAGTIEVLSSRASCYKEVGEYKKAVADCTKVLDHNDTNTSVLVQRALLYESMEKYKLGAEDLRTVMKLDPGNRVARSTIHRLTKMAES